jgi:hydroxymethylglutaryl-CoA lyase
VHVRAYLSCVVACPYEGSQEASIVTNLASTLLEMGAKEISFGDTIGVATPQQTKTLILQAIKLIPIEKIGMHFHNTYGQALANVYQSMLLGVSTFDSSVAGLGGCPYAPGASGNVASEDVLYLCQGLGIETGIELEKLAKVGKMISLALGRHNQSNAAKALLSKLREDPLC